MTKIKNIKTTVYQWKGKTVPPQKTFVQMLLMFFMKNQMQWVLLDFMSG